MNVIDLIEQAKKNQGIETDMALAKALDVSRSAVSSWRKGVQLPDTVRCAALAGMTGIPLAKVLGVVGEARAISREEKAVWRKLAASAAAVVLMVLAIPLPGYSAHGQQSGKCSVSGPVAASQTDDYAKFWIARGREILTTLRLVLRWLRWRLSGRKPGPDNLEAYAC